MIHIAPPEGGGGTNEDYVQRLRESGIGHIYKYLKRLRVIQLLANWFWRNGCIVFRKTNSLYVKFSPKMIPLIKFSVYATRSTDEFFRFVDAETVSLLFAQVFPADEKHCLSPTRENYVFPELFATQISKAQVNGGTNLVLSGEIALCHDLYDFSRDYTSEEMHGRAVINPRVRRVSILVNDLRPESFPVAATFVDACAVNYAHWLTEVLPRVSLFCSIDRFKDIPIIVNGGLHPNIMESLFLVAGRGRTIITLPIGRALNVGRLFVVSPTGYVPFERRTSNLIGHVQGRFSPYALKSLNKKIKEGLASNGTSFPKRFFIRRNAGSRLLVNSDEIEKRLVVNGFAVVEPEKFSFVEQVKLFANAEIIVGPTGAAFANIVFCNSSVRIVVLLSKHKCMPYRYWQNMASAVGCRVDYVLGNIIREQNRGFHADFQINPVDVLDAIG